MKLPVPADTTNTCLPGCPSRNRKSLFLFHSLFMYMLYPVTNMCVPLCSNTSITQIAHLHWRTEPHTHKHITHIHTQSIHRQRLVPSMQKGYVANKHLFPYPGTGLLAAIGLLSHVVKVTLQGRSQVGGLYGAEKRQR